MGLHCAGPPHMVTIWCFLCIWQDPYRKNASEELLLHPPWKHGEENLTPQCLFTILSPSVVTPCGFHWRLKLGTSLTLLSWAGLSFVHGLKLKGSTGRSLCLEAVDRNSTSSVKLLTCSTMSHLRCCETAEVLRLIWPTWHSTYRRHMSAWRGSQRPTTPLQGSSSVSEDAAHTWCPRCARCLSSQCGQLKPRQCSQQLLKAAHGTKCWGATQLPQHWYQFPFEVFSHISTIHTGWQTWSGAINSI